MLFLQLNHFVVAVGIYEFYICHICGFLIRPFIRKMRREPFNSSSLLAFYLCVAETKMQSGDASA